MRGRTDLWILTVSTPPAHAVAVSDLFEDDAVSIAIMSPPRQSFATVEAIFNYEPDAGEMAARTALYSALYHVDLPKPDIKPAPNLDWLKKVASDFPPLKIARWTVHGALHRDKVPNRLWALQIDATNAFGTGEHPTTRGCLLMLDKILKSGFRPRRMADIGCGSGILAMACVQGARGRARGVDLDADSVQIALGNARANGLAPFIRAGRGSGYAASFMRAGAPYDLIMANIFAGPLSRMAKDLKKHLRPGGIAILSGLLTAQANQVIAAHRMQGLALIEHVKLGEWSVLALNRPQRA